jgi:hypothetical protein
MANYYAIIRTNYFGVTDEAKFREIVDSCRAEDTIHIFGADDGSGKIGFGCSGSIYGIPASEDEDDMEDDLDAFYDALQSVLAEGDAIIITEIGYEKLRYLIGYCSIITKDDIQSIDVRSKAIELARVMLNNPEFTTEMDY